MFPESPSLCASSLFFRHQPSMGRLYRRFYLQVHSLDWFEGRLQETICFSQQILRKILLLPSLKLKVNSARNFYIGCKKYFSHAKSWKTRPAWPTALGASPGAASTTTLLPSCKGQHVACKSLDCFSMGYKSHLKLGYCSVCAHVCFHFRLKFGIYDVCVCMYIYIYTPNS